MAQGRHSRTMLSRAWWMGLLAVVVAVLLGAGTAFAAYGYDRSSRTRILPGVRVGGIAVGGMTRDQAIRAVTARADTSLAGDLLVTAAGYSWHVTPAALGTRADVNGAVDQAFAAADRLSLLSRVFHRVAGKPVHADIPVKYAHDQAKVRAFVQQAYDEVTEPAVDAGIDLVDNELVMRKSKPGEELKAQVGAARLLRAIDRQ
ncbi:MAG TPA: peptidoglycan binding domain-containing protein, partial [Actinomycetota bacterium]